MTLPGENGQNLVEWRFRKEQARGKTVVFGRKLRVRKLPAQGTMKKTPNLSDSYETLEIGKINLELNY